MNKGRVPQYGAIDFAKFMCALLIVVSHYISENATGRINSLFDYASSLYIIVVPFFFVCSGFFLFKKLFDSNDNHREIIVAYCRRNFVLYIGWSTIYVLFKILTWIRFGTTKQEVLQYLLNSLFYSTYQTIWFLPALCVGVIITYFLYKKMGIKRTMLVAMFLYFIGALGVSYGFLLEGTFVEDIVSIYNSIFVSTRNGFFNGFPFVTIGALIAKERTEKRNVILKRDLIFTCLLGCAFIAEAFVLKFLFNAVNANTLIFLIPFSYFFVRFCLNIPLKSGSILLWMRKMSTTIFLCQRLYLSAIPLLFPNGLCARLLIGNPYIGCVFVITITMLTAWGIIVLSNKSKIFKFLC